MLRSEVFTAETMKNAVFWDIKKTVLYMTGNTLRLRYRAQQVDATLRSEVFAAVTMKNAVFWDIKPQFLSHMKNSVFWHMTPCGSCGNRSVGGTYFLLHEG
jgi:hypothetical protein